MMNKQKMFYISYKFYIQCFNNDPIILLDIKNYNIIIHNSTDFYGRNLIHTALIGGKKGNNKLIDYLLNSLMNSNEFQNLNKIRNDKN